MHYICFIYFEPVLYLIDTVYLNGMETNINTAQHQRDYTLNMSFVCSRLSKVPGL